MTNLELEKKISTAFDDIAPDDFEKIYSISLTNQKIRKKKAFAFVNAKKEKERKGTKNATRLNCKNIYNPRKHTRHTRTNIHCSTYVSYI